jgi:hypothetical protein
VSHPCRMYVGQPLSIQNEYYKTFSPFWKNPNGAPFLNVGPFIR